MDVFKVLNPGPMTTVQDLGRVGYGRFGVPISGCVDQFSAMAANLLLGNPFDAPVLEITFIGPKLKILADTQIAITGAKVPVTVNDEKIPLWTSVNLSQGDKLTFKPAVKGIRAYLAVSGGFDIPKIMGSYSTYVGAKIGGFEGRALAAKDILGRKETDVLTRKISVPDELRPNFDPKITLRAIRGPQDDYFDQGLDAFFSSEFKVTTKADRMGYRLEGPVIQQKPGMPTSIISEPSLAGAIQIPPDGQPIILLVEQTVGGYTKPATVISSDIGLVAQARPGDSIFFKEVDLDEAHKAYMEHQAKIKTLTEALA